MHLPILWAPKVSEDPPPHVDLPPFWNSHLFLLSLCSMAQVIFQLIPSTSLFPECAWLGSWFIKWGAANNNLVFWALSLPSWPAPVPVTPCPFSHRCLAGQLPPLQSLISPSHAEMTRLESLIFSYSFPGVVGKIRLCFHSFEIK